MDTAAAAAAAVVVDLTSEGGKSSAAKLLNKPKSKLSTNYTLAAGGGGGGALGGGGIVTGGVVGGSLGITTELDIVNCLGSTVESMSATPPTTPARGEGAIMGTINGDHVMSINGLKDASAENCPMESTTAAVTLSSLASLASLAPTTSTSSTNASTTPTSALLTAPATTATTTTATSATAITPATTATATTTATPTTTILKSSTPKRGDNLDDIDQLLHWQDMPKYLQFNPYVLKGYRPLQTFKGCLLSLFYWHNETINILTHALKGVCKHAVLLLLWVGLEVKGHWLSPLSQQKLDTHIQLKNHWISQHNDSVYVQRVMRFAKSAEIRSYMQTEQHQCDDFFAYSCGNWAKINPANDMKPRETNYQQLLTHGLNHKQQKLLEQPSDAEIDEPAVYKLKEFYASCLRYKQQPAPLYRQQLIGIVSEFGRMPALELNSAQWNETEFDWLATVAKIRQKYGLNIVLRLQEVNSPKNQTERRLHVGQPAQLTVEYNPKTTEERISQELREHLGLQLAKAVTTAREIVEFEVRLAKGMASYPLGVLATPRSTLELSEAYAPTMNLTRYVELALRRNLTSEERVFEHVPSYLKHLSAVLNETSPRVISNYIFYKLSQSFFYVQGASSVVNSCLESSRKQFPELLNQMVYRQYVDEASLSDIEAVWQDIKRSFRHLIEGAGLDWLKLATREQLLQCVNATRLLINGYAHVNFTEVYQHLEVQSQNYLQNLCAVLSYTAEQPLATPTGQSSVARYDATENQVVLPISLLQPNYLWSRYYPRALRYGSLGAILAQQLAHSLDNRDHWDAASLTEFGKRKACFKHQYELLRYGGEYLPPTELQDENIADNTAVQVAFHAYLSFLDNLASSALSTEELPQLELTPQQLFFVGYAQLWCNDANAQFREKQSLLAPGTPNALRIQAALSNFAAFSSTFKCARDDRMNPSQKCRMYALNLN